MSYFECVSVTLMLECNLTKSDEFTFIVLNVDWVFVRNLACSRRSDSGERCEVKRSTKNKSEGEEVREGAPVRFVFIRLFRPLKPHQL